MSISAISSLSFYPTATSAKATEKDSETQTVSSTSDGDTLQLSGASGGGSTAQVCPKGNDACLGCGACKSAAGGVSAAAGSNGQSGDPAMLAAINAYSSHLKSV